jgi:hypothetical protein
MKYNRDFNIKKNIEREIDLSTKVVTSKKYKKINTLKRT